MTYSGLDGPPYPGPDRARARPDAGQFWAGGLATAVVAALIALAGVLVCRWTLGIPILAPSRDGAWGSVHTGEFVLVAAIVALAAAGVLYLLLLAAPRPALFFRWIMGLVTVVAAVYPFSTGAPLDQKAATAAVNVILGIAITSLLTAVAARAVRYYRGNRPDGRRPSGVTPPAPRYGRYGPDNVTPPAPRYGPDNVTPPAPRYGPDNVTPPAPRYGQDQTPTRPMYPRPPGPRP